MSTHDFLHDPSGGFHEEQIDAALDAVEFHHQHIAPMVRQCNRHLNDLLGRCPNSPSGDWVTADVEGNATFRLVDVADVARLGVILENISRRLDLEEMGAVAPSRASLRLFLQTLIRDHQVPVEGASIHLGARRNHRNLRKGR